MLDPPFLDYMFDKIKIGWSILYLERPQSRTYSVFQSMNLIKSADPDGLHCLIKFKISGFKLKKD